MICENYDSLSPIDKVIFIGKIVHALQSSNVIFSDVERIIWRAQAAGVFDGVTILPDSNPLLDGKEEESA